MKVRHRIIIVIRLNNRPVNRKKRRKADFLIVFRSCKTLIAGIRKVRRIYGENIPINK